MKKVYALLLVAVMTVAMAVPTFAANSPEAEYGIQIFLIDLRICKIKAVQQVSIIIDMCCENGIM